MKYFIFSLLIFVTVSCSKKCSNDITGEYVVESPSGGAGSRVDYTETHQIRYYLSSSTVISTLEYTADCDEVCLENHGCDSYTFDGTFLVFDGSLVLRKIN